MSDIRNRKKTTGNTKDSIDDMELYRPSQHKKKSVWCSGKTKICMKVTGVLAAVLTLGLPVSDKLKKDLTTPSIERVPRTDYNNLLNLTLNLKKQITKLEKELRESKALVKKNKENGVIDAFKNAMKKSFRV